MKKRRRKIFQEEMMLKMRLKDEYQEKRTVSEDRIIRGPASYGVSLLLCGDGKVAGS